MPMSQHYEQPQQLNYSNHPMSRHRPDMATTLPTVGRIELFKCRDIATTLWRHHNKLQPMKTLAKHYRDIKAMSRHQPRIEHWRSKHLMSRHRLSNVATSNQSSLGDETSQMSRHRINVTTSVKTLVEDFRATRFNVSTSEQQCRDIS